MERWVRRELKQDLAVSQIRKETFKPSEPTEVHRQRENRAEMLMTPEARIPFDIILKNSERDRKAEGIYCLTSKNAVARAIDKNNEMVPLVQYGSARTAIE